MRSLGWTAVFALASAVLASLPGAATQVQAPAAAVDAAAAYVRRYQHDLTSVIADETYTQRVRAQVPRDGLRPLRATLTSEVFFMFAGGEWMAIRDVRALNGTPLTDRPDLRAALLSLPASQVARRFKSYNSRFNVGRITRNFNEPTLALSVLDDRHRPRFAFVAERAARGLVTLRFREIKGPTLIRSLDGGDVFAEGSLTVVPESGRVTDARLALAIGPVTVTLSTRFAVDARLGMAVPVRFGERYEEGALSGRAGRRAGTRREDIMCEATYRNFRRFEVASRIR